MSTIKMSMLLPLAPHGLELGCCSKLGGVGNIFDNSSFRMMPVVFGLFEPLAPEAPELCAPADTLSLLISIVSVFRHPAFDLLDPGGVCTIICEREGNY